MDLRWYQQEMLEAIARASTRPDPILIQAATGAGKSLVMITEAVRTPGVSAILSARNKLVEQTARVARGLTQDVGVWSAGQSEKTISRVNVVSIQSAGELVIPDLHTVIIDECHGMSERHSRFLARHPGVRVIGFTATPWRQGRPAYGGDCFFPTVNYSIGMRRLIDEGFLVRPVARAMPDAWDARGLEIRGGDYVAADLGRLVRDGGKIAAQIADALPRLDGRSRVVWTCVSIEHAEAVGNVLADAGERVAVIHSRSPDPEYALTCFERGDVRHAVSVMMLSEGVDIPSVDAVVLMRPTRSPTLAVQTVGRGLRPYPGKVDCAVLDYGAIIENCGPVDAPYIRETRRRAGEREAPTIRVCSECLAYVPYSTPECPECGHVERGVQRRLAEQAKELARRAAEIEMLARSQPEEFECLSAVATQYFSSKGNDCIRLTFTMRNRIHPIHVYGSQHPYSWQKCREHLYKLTPFRFNSWRECYDAVPSFGRSLEAPRRIVIKRGEKHDEVIGVYN